MYKLCYLHVNIMLYVNPKLIYLSLPPSSPVSCIKPGLEVHFTYDTLHVSMPLSHIIPPLPSPIEFKRLFYTSVSLLMSCIQGYRYHLSKFHIYALVYCIGVFLSGLLHSDTNFLTKQKQLTDSKTNL